MQPAPRDSRLPHVEPAPAARSTVRTVVSLTLSQKDKQTAKNLSQKENKNHPAEKEFNKTTPKKKGEREKYSAEVLTTNVLVKSYSKKKNTRTPMENAECGLVETGVFLPRSL